MTDSRSRRRGLRAIDRFFGLFGVPSATGHDAALAGLEAASARKREISNSAQALIDAARTLDESLVKGER